MAGHKRIAKGDGTIRLNGTDLLKAVDHRIWIGCAEPKMAK
jgi:hypothetical protein